MVIKMIAQLDSFYIKTRPWKLWSRLVSYALFEGRPLTTRGRWINPLLFLLFSIEKRLPQLRPVKKPVFIIGTGRSGTTILGKIISIHKDVGFLNEPKAMWHYIYPCEDVIGNYTRGSAFYRLDEKVVTSETVKVAHRLYGAYLAFSSSWRVVDKYPELIFRSTFVKAIFHDAKFIFLVRNGWDTIQSIKDWSERFSIKTNNEIHDWWGYNRRKWNLLLEQIVPEHEDLLPHMMTIQNLNNHTEMAAIEWIVTMREGLKVMEKYPNDALMVKYEDICNEPHEYLNKVISFLELDEDNKVIQYSLKVLKPKKPKAPCLLNKVIEVPFLNTMKQVGYID